MGGSVFPQRRREAHSSPSPQPARTRAVAGSATRGVVDPGDRAADATRAVDDQPRTQTQHRLGEGITASHRASAVGEASGQAPAGEAGRQHRASFYVQGKLAKRWSPQQISHRLIKDFPTIPEMRASTETIYQAIYVHARGELTREPGKQLRRGRIARKPHKQPAARRPRFVDPMNSISNRPAEVDSRKVPGHWEGDLIIGALGGSATATLVERSSRFVMLGHLGRERTAEAVRDSLITTVHHLPASLRGTLTWDQGAEMVEHCAFATATNFDVYFADAGAPWQRGSNENANGLLRQYFPRSTDLAAHSVDKLLAVAEELNDRPRKSLDWDTPAERLSALLAVS
ncbi:IS30 family transposase [Rhodococcus erythropolis]